MPRHNYELWTDGEYHVLESGVDFHCTPRSMLNNLYGVGPINGRTPNISPQFPKADGTPRIVVRFPTPGSGKFEPGKYLQSLGETVTWHEPKGRDPKYPWDAWTDGEYHGILFGPDFQITVPSMRKYLERYAKDNKLHIDISTEDQSGSRGKKSHRIVFKFSALDDCQAFNLEAAYIHGILHRQGWMGFSERDGLLMLSQLIATLAYDYPTEYARMQLDRSREDHPQVWSRVDAMEADEVDRITSAENKRQELARLEREQELQTIREVWKK